MVVLYTVGTDPCRQLLMPYQCMTAHFHVMTLGQAHQTIAGIEIELSPVRLYGIDLHLVFGHNHIEVMRYRRSLHEVLVIHVDTPKRDSHSDFLPTLLGIVTQGLSLIGIIIAKIRRYQTHIIDIKIGIVGVIPI